MEDGEPVGDGGGAGGCWCESVTLPGFLRREEASMATEISCPRVLDVSTESRLRAWEFLRLIVRVCT